MQVTNPFVVQGYLSPHYFCDRVEETRYLSQLVTNGNNVALISPRRMGKTGLILHCLNQASIKEAYYTICRRHLCDEKPAGVRLRAGKSHHGNTEAERPPRLGSCS